MQRKTRFYPLALVVMLAWGATAAIAVAQSERKPEEPPETRLIQINLLAASKGGSSDLSDLPANTRKAIEDVEAFLPFKSYRLLDTSLEAHPLRAAMVSPSAMERFQPVIAPRAPEQVEGEDASAPNVAPGIQLPDTGPLTSTSFSAASAASLPGFPAL